MRLRNNGSAHLTFWIIAIAAALIVGAVIVRPLLSRADGAAPRAAHDAQVFRDQLKELERDVARGTVSAEDAETTRLEISRRLLAADEEMRMAGGAGPAPKGLSRAVAAIAFIAAPVAAGLLYLDHGAPGAEDAPFETRAAATRPSQADAEKMMAGRELGPPAEGEAVEEFRRLVVQLEARLAEAPNDKQGVTLYARSLLNLGRFADASKQFEKLIDLNGGKAPGEIFAGWSEAMILAAGGYISPEAEDALLQTLKREPTNPSARYYLGHLHAQAGDVELAEGVWGRLIEESDPNAPWIEPIRREMAQLGLGPRGRDGLPGPTQEEIQSAGSIPPAERQAMVADMVNRLAERLDAEGGSVAEWQRLIRSYSVLGQSGKAQEAMEKAEAAFAGDPAALAALARGDALGAAPQQDGGFSLPPQQGQPGPTGEDIANAAEMAPEDRAAMIEGMVARLRERLEKEGGSPDEWLRLITSLGVMGRQEEAREAYAAARAAYADDPRALSIMEAAIEGAPRAAQSDQRGPTQEDVEAAREMDPNDRQAMIRGMVSQLHDRLRDEGRAADVNEWGKLMRSYNVLGQADAVRAAYDEATGIYDDDAIALAYLKEAALLAGADLN